MALLSVCAYQRKVLTETLRRLEFNGLIGRRAHAEAPPRVEYALAELGTSLLGPIEAFGEWAHQYGDDVLDAQDRYAIRSAAETAAS